MITSSGGPAETPRGTHVGELPPLNVTTEGIPAQEHLSVPVRAVPDEHTTRLVAWVIGIVAVVLIAAATAFIATTWSTLTPVAGWQYHPTSERGMNAVDQVVGAP